MSTSKTKNKYQIAVIPGDGIGKEVMEATISVLDELNNSQCSGFDKIRTRLYLSLYQYCIGSTELGQQTAMELWEELRKKTTHLIEKTECLALIDMMNNQNHLAEISDELKPWYAHATSIIRQICA